MTAFCAFICAFNSTSFCLRSFASCSNSAMVFLAILIPPFFLAELPHIPNCQGTITKFYMINISYIYIYVKEILLSYPQVRAKLVRIFTRKKLGKRVLKIRAAFPPYTIEPSFLALHHLCISNPARSLHFQPP